MINVIRWLHRRRQSFQSSHFYLLTVTLRLIRAEDYLSHTRTQQTHHECVRGAHTVEAVVEGSKLFIDGFVEQQVDVQLHVLCREQKHSMSRNAGTALEQELLDGKSAGRGKIKWLFWAQVCGLCVTGGFINLCADVMVKTL